MTFKGHGIETKRSNWEIIGLTGGLHHAATCQDMLLPLQGSPPSQMQCKCTGGNTACVLVQTLKYFSVAS